MEWVPIPNRMDGDGYTELLDHPNGAAHFGAWIALVQIASKCEPRGTLLREPFTACNCAVNTPRPHTAFSISRISRIPASVISEVLPRLMEIGWIEDICTETKELPNLAPSCDEVPSMSHPSDYGMEWNGMEEKNISASCDAGAFALSPPEHEAEIPATKPSMRIIEQEPPEFAAFWALRWRSQDRAAAVVSFRKQATTPAKTHQIMEAVRAQRDEILLCKKQKRPYMSTWLNKRRFADEPDSDDDSNLLLPAAPIPAMTELQRLAAKMDEKFGGKNGSK